MPPRRSTHWSRLSIAAATMILLILSLTLVTMPGCGLVQSTNGTHEVDWQRVHVLLSEADEAIESYRLMLVDAGEIGERRQTLEQVRQVNQTVIAAVEQRLEDDAAPDPGPEISRLLRMASTAIAAWPDPRQRAIATTVYSSVRVGLLLAGLDVHAPSPPPDKGSGEEAEG